VRHFYGPGYVASFRAPAPNRKRASDDSVHDPPPVGGDVAEHSLAEECASKRASVGNLSQECTQ